MYTFLITTYGCFLCDGDLETHSDLKKCSNKKTPGYFEDVCTSFEQKQFALKTKELHHCHSCNRSFAVHGQRRGMLQVKEHEADSKIVVISCKCNLTRNGSISAFFPKKKSRYLLLIQQH